MECLVAGIYNFKIPNRASWYLGTANLYRLLFIGDLTSVTIDRSKFDGRCIVRDSVGIDLIFLGSHTPQLAAIRKQRLKGAVERSRRAKRGRRSEVIPRCLQRGCSLAC